MSKAKDFDKDEYGRYTQHCNMCKCKTPHIKGMCLACKSRVEQKTVYSQVWRCKACGTAGSTIYIEDEPYQNIIDRIIAEHRNKTILCPGRLDDLWIFGPMDSIS